MKINNKGFTMIEIIIVLIILGVLVAVALPSMTGYIDKAHEPAALAECRSVILASKIEFMQEVKTGTSASTSLSIEQCEKFIKMAYVDGEILKATVLGDGVDFMLYLASNGLYVEYDITKNPLYRVVDAKYASSLIGVNLDKLSENYAQTITDIRNAGDRWIDRRAAITKIFEANGTLEKVDDVLLEGTNIDSSNLYWRPYYLNEGSNPIATSVFLFAGNGNTPDHSGWNTQVVHFNGTVYVSSSKKGISGWNGQNAASMPAWLEKQGFVPVSEYVSG